MEYRGPEPADLANVEALNQAFLRWLRERPDDPAFDGEVAPGISARIRGIKDHEIERLARAPFLLMSLNEEDERRWRDVFANAPCMDLLDARYRCGEVENRLTLAVLGFLWQLARRNPYTTRLVSGVSLNWCEQLSALPLVALYAQVDRCSPLQPRLAKDGELWRKLLEAGVSARQEVRWAARVSAMQTVITGSPAATRRPFAAAACNMPAVSMRVAARNRN
jgi:hypothetical protein